MDAKDRALDIADPARQREVAFAVLGLVNLCHGLSVKSGWWFHRETSLDLRDMILSPEGYFERMLAGALVAVASLKVLIETAPPYESSGPRGFAKIRRTEKENE